MIGDGDLQWRAVRVVHASEYDAGHDQRCSRDGQENGAVRQCLCENDDREDPPRESRPAREKKRYNL